jgi:hypothetical protein
MRGQGEKENRDAGREDDGVPDEPCLRLYFGKDPDVEEPEESIERRSYDNAQAQLEEGLLVIIFEELLLELIRKSEAKPVKRHFFHRQKTLRETAFPTE